jgi:hypothetical protein
MATKKESLRRRLHLQYYWWIDKVTDRVSDKWPKAPDWIYAFNEKTYLCWLLGHYPGLDNCTKPEHDFCLFCHKLMPGQAEDRPAFEQRMRDQENDAG